MVPWPTKRRVAVSQSESGGPPSPLPGVDGLTGRNQMRLVWWAVRSRLHGVSGWWLAAAAIATAAVSAWITRPLGTGVAVITATVVVVLYLAGVIVFAAAVQLLVNTRRRHRGWLVGYLTTDASQLVHPDPAGAWVLSDHFARRRGHGLAAVFRRQVFKHLAEQADHHQVVIEMETHAEKLAKLYIQDMPGLRVVAQRRTINGPTWTLRRDPRHDGS